MRLIIGTGVGLYAFDFVRKSKEFNTNIFLSQD